MFDEPVIRTVGASIDYLIARDKWDTRMGGEGPTVVIKCGIRESTELKKLYEFCDRYAPIAFDRNHELDHMDRQYSEHDIRYWRILNNGFRGIFCTIFLSPPV
jgi:hypothetical protein